MYTHLRTIFSVYHLEYTPRSVIFESYISYSPTPETSNNETPPPKPLQ